ncbi:hypothetical protein FD16_GL002032 [Paucilactobacillus suebicus DSM 5007 = KCTC 3549]|uniref:YdhG-like domain-containing protein n=1 Tax=Paucilactobacillus suebicus DSM 5007 = KCTC 3549 TaxID=1423807 RepID=A0A0R1W5Y9_9LACO|nr:hypothetical protein FD16_GL002032 [Paucilactobacillus suebicus DSM 5007 = KCTC 3549]
MDSLADFFKNINDDDQRKQLHDVLDWITERFPHLRLALVNESPMFTDHKTDIIEFNATEGGIVLISKSKGFEQFKDDISAAGYLKTKDSITIPWQKEIDYGLLDEIIAWQVQMNSNTESYWR